MLSNNIVSRFAKTQCLGSNPGITAHYVQFINNINLCDNAAPSPHTLYSALEYSDGAIIFPAFKNKKKKKKKSAT